MLLSPPSARERWLAATTALSLALASISLSFPATNKHAVLASSLSPMTFPSAFTQRNRSVIVTGASKGIGKGIATVFSEAGASVLITSRHFNEAQAVADDLVRAGGVAYAFAGDVSVEADVAAMVARAVDLFGGIDVLCANAGVMPSSLIEETSVAEWDETMGINARGAFLSVKHALPSLKQSAFGRVILTSSITGPITGFPGWGNYGASKAAQLGFVRSASVELAKYKITVNAVSPGNVLTEGLAAFGAPFLEGVKRVIPVDDLGTPRDIGYAALYLASREAGFVTGQTIVLDGGQTLPETPDFRAVW
ncbi:hypothetical protein AB1Y20_012858 [Prymnesium parvum]|uniref:3-oxoacyl-[acyl-carrier-protein] reductase n=1 Tax=Prymnesium parvum TaxID=97485 RepID=A0AB34IL16_PRYPA